MLTKNFYAYMRGALQGVTVDFKITNGGKKYSTSITTSSIPPFKAIGYWATDFTSKGVCFGTGTTPPTLSDYYLESVLDNAQIAVTPPSAVAFSQGDAFDEYSASFGVTNKTDGPVTISEVGLLAYPGVNAALVDRTVLDTPVTIPAHETKHIAYTIRFNY